MFKIMQDMNHRFSLAEILLMAAMNEVEAKRKDCGQKEIGPRETLIKCSLSTASTDRVEPA